MAAVNTNLGNLGQERSRVLSRSADSLPRFFPMLTTAAGTIAPAKVLVLGAGVAGLQAIATARRLGAVVFGFDVRPAVREQVQSLGASFLDLGVVGADQRIVREIDGNRVVGATVVNNSEMKD